jgi:hypothetical protein
LEGVQNPEVRARHGVDVADRLRPE